MPPQLIIKNIMQKEGTLTLQDGTVFFGKAIGYRGISAGEVCFNTGMTGYQEIYTDPSYYGQIVINTLVHVGNYGILPNESQAAKPMVKGIIIKDLPDNFSRHQANPLENYLEENKIVGLAEIDTRHLVKKIRTQGAMNGVITTTDATQKDIEIALKEAPDMHQLELASQVSTTKMYTKGNPSNASRVAIVDVGVKNSIVEQLTQRNNYCAIFPHNSSCKEILDWSPTGIMISNGPGDPMSMDDAIETVGQLLDIGIPIFGICLGHQIIALAAGCKTYKMYYGHRGLNHPVKNLKNGICQITSQNHGFSIDVSSVKKYKNIEVTHVNLNDQTIEGMELKDKNAFCVQYHPEAAPGPHDAFGLFDKFQGRIEEYTKSKGTAKL